MPVFFGNELEDGVLCAAPDRIMVTGLFPCGWLADRRQLHQIADRLWGRFSLKWPFSFDTCGRPHLPPETDLAAGGFPVCWLLLVLPVDETCELLILVLEHYGTKRCCRASICAGPSLLAVARFSGCLVLQFQHAAVLLDLWWPDAEYTVGFALAAEVYQVETLVLGADGVLHAFSFLSTDLMLLPGGKTAQHLEQQRCTQQKKPHNIITPHQQKRRQVPANKVSSRRHESFDAKLRRNRSTSKSLSLSAQPKSKQQQSNIITRQQQQSPNFPTEAAHPAFRMQCKKAGDQNWIPGSCRR
ncbi:hypothetical protein Nepgr_026626 [Nepenthes gracilis]|uniref:Uncharacterized protein n=1 Tax=Nepenthes gracilis TaxID=150966 RepID=A0AAD3T7J2_NEPGR|nr:hypothetical protein Nepgr_026626 [Nepenthes gracilis]